VSEFIIYTGGLSFGWGVYLLPNIWLSSGVEKVSRRLKNLNPEENDTEVFAEVM
jgi:hypothetical protein